MINFLSKIFLILKIIFLNYLLNYFYLFFFSLFKLLDTKHISSHQTDDKRTI
jgi:hypothetical protein